MAQIESPTGLRLRVVVECECPECGWTMQWTVTHKHWIFDAPIALEVCTACEAPLELVAPPNEDLPRAIDRLATEGTANK